MDKREDKIKTYIKRFIGKIVKLGKIERVILFGSRARGDFRKISDVDLIIVSKDFEKQPFYARSQQFYLLWDYPDDVEIDIICLTPKELNIRKRTSGIVHDAIKEGIEISLSA